MFCKRFLPVLRYRNKNTQNTIRTIQISVIGAAGDIGSNLAMLLKFNDKVTKLHLYDNDEKVRGVALELAYIPRGPAVAAFAGEQQLPSAVRDSKLVLMVSRVARKLGNTREQMLASNAPPVQTVCKTISKHNPETFLAISTNPINSIIPFASTLLMSYNTYNPFKLFGITHIDTARARAFVGESLKVNPRNLQIPVIGGHSDETIVPLFSNIRPESCIIDTNRADMLTRRLRKAGVEVIINKQGMDSATMAMAWSINEFAAAIVNAICGAEVTVNSYTANPHYGTRFFSGPIDVCDQGITKTCCDFNMNNYEWELLQKSLPILNRDITQGEDFVHVVESSGNDYT